MQTSLNSFPPSNFLHTPQQFIKNRPFSFSRLGQLSLPLISSQIDRRNHHPLQCTGRRWLRQQVSGRETIREVTLVEGRGGHKGQKSWILRLSEVDTVEQAQQLVGSTLLVPEEDRPDLEEGKFYTRDVIGMTVILKETGEVVGTVVNVFDSGAGDLLQVMLNKYLDLSVGTGKPKSDISVSGPLVWVPFVEAIVPNVDMNKREMLITPPKGLLELNICSDERSKKERRQIEWKERKKLQKRLIAAKKKLSDMEQQHVFHGFRHGTKTQGTLLANQIVDVNSKLLQLALQNTQLSSKRWDVMEFIEANITEQMMSTFHISEEASSVGSGEKLKESSKLLERSCLLTSKGKVGIVIVMDGSSEMENVAERNIVDPEIDSEMTVNSPCIFLQSLLSEDHRFVKIEDRHVTPLVFISPARVVSYLQNLFSNNDHFGFDSNKVWFVEEEKLPVVSSSLEDSDKNKILMKSPWEILQVPVGSGGVISSLSFNNVLENLCDMGVEYIEVCAANQRYVGGQSLLGLVDSSNAHVGIRFFKNTDNGENFHMIFSMNFMKQLTKDLDKLHFHAIPRLNSHVQKVDKELVDVAPPSSNSYELRSSIYTTLKSSPPGKVCVLEVPDKF